MAFATVMIVDFTADGFSREIESLDPDNCTCECYYVLQENDWYKLVTTTLLFIALNLKFLWSWMNATMHGRHYLYLVQYTLPLKYANQINSTNCTGDMMEVIAKDDKGEIIKGRIVLTELDDVQRTKAQIDDMYQLLEETPKDEQGKYNFDVKMNEEEKEKYIERKVEEKMRLAVQFAFRMALFYLAFVWCSYRILHTLMKTANLNAYGYPFELRLCMYIGNLIGTIVYIIIGFKLVNKTTQKWVDRVDKR